MQVRVEGAPRRIAVPEAGSYYAFPDICRLKGRSLLCVFYAGYGHVSLPSEKAPKGGRIVAMRSDDDGATWSAPWTAIDTPADDRDPSLCRLPFGELLCTFFTYGGPDVYDTYLSRSKDEGRTWSEPECILPSFATSTPIRRLRSGRLVLPVYRVDGQKKRAYAAVCLSDDKGRTWRSPRPIGLDYGKTLDETDVYERKDGTLLAISREVMTASESKDGGVTWSTPRPLDFPGHCPCLNRTPEGVLMLAHRLPGTALHFSEDEGRSWRGPVPIDTVIGAYPSMVTLRNGQTLCLYYEEGAGSGIRAATLRVE